MDVYIPSAKESCRFYDPARFHALSLKPKIEALWSKVFVGSMYMAMYKIHYFLTLSYSLFSYNKGYWWKLICLDSVTCCCQNFKVIIRIWTKNLGHCISGCPMSLQKFYIALKILDCCVLMRYSSTLWHYGKKRAIKRKWKICSIFVVYNGSLKLI
jgi:hypothetical protein